MTGTILPQIKGHLTMQRNANMLKILKKSAFLQILLVSLQKCSPQSVPRKNFYPSGKFCNTLNINRLNLVFYILCGANKNSASKNNMEYFKSNLISCSYFLWF